MAREIDDFLNGEVFAVAGASTDRTKYGNKVLRCYQQAGREVIPVNPRATEVEGIPCVPDLGSLQAEVHGLSIITPPGVTEALVAIDVNMTSTPAESVVPLSVSALHVPKLLLPPST